MKRQTRCHHAACSGFNVFLHALPEGRHPSSEGTRQSPAPPLQHPATIFFMPCQRQGIRVPKEIGITMAGTGREQPAFRAGNPGGAVSCDTKCDAISPDRVQLLARAVILVAGMRIPEPMRAAVLDRVIADLGKHSASQSEG